MCFYAAFLNNTDLSKKRRAPHREIQKSPYKTSERTQVVFRRLVFCLRAGLVETVESMYPPWQNYQQQPTPNLTVYESMNLSGDQYDALKRQLSQSAEQAVNGVSELILRTYSYSNTQIVK